MGKQNNLFHHTSASSSVASDPTTIVKYRKRSVLVVYVTALLAYGTLQQQYSWLVDSAAAPTLSFSASPENTESCGSLAGRSLESLRTWADEDASRPLRSTDTRAVTSMFETMAAATLVHAWSETARVTEALASPAPRRLQNGAPADARAEIVVPTHWKAKAAALRIQQRADSAAPPRPLNATRVIEEPTHPLLLAADVFLVGACVVLMAAQECDWQLDWRDLRIAIVGGWAAADCPLDAEEHCPAARSLISSHGVALPMSRVRERTYAEWSISAEFCVPSLATVDTVDVQFSGWGLLPIRRKVARDDVARRPQEEIAVAIHFSVKDSFLVPYWIQHWRALGCSRFYLYLNGPLEAIKARDPAIAAQLTSDPRVTLIEWNLRFLQKNGLDPIPGLCSGHLSQMLSFNHVFERFRRRHLYIGYFDADELGVLSAEMLERAARCSMPPLLLLLGSYGFPAVLALPNQYGVVSGTGHAPHPAVASHAADVPPAVLTPTEVLKRNWYGHYEFTNARAKSLVRTFGQRHDVNVGNHDVFEMVGRSVDAKSGTVYQSGTGYETNSLRLAQLADSSEAGMLHIMNFKPHVSNLGLNVSLATEHMVATEAYVAAIHTIAALAQASCQQCSGASGAGVAAKSGQGGCDASSGGGQDPYPC